MTAIDAIFREIANNVILLDAEEVIAVRVAAIAVRLRETTSHRPLLFEGQTDHNDTLVDVLSAESAASDRASCLSETEGSLSDLQEHCGVQARHPGVDVASHMLTGTSSERDQELVLF